MSRSIFEIEGGRFVPTDLARGPWDPAALHGGAVAALFVREMEGAAPGRLLARLTCEFLRPVPVAPLRAETEILREGRSVAWLRARVSADGRPVAEATAVALRRRPGAASRPEGERPPGPERGRAGSGPPEGSYTAFHNAGMEVRFVEGSLIEPGPAIVWFRMAVPLVPEEEPSPLVRVAAAADFSNGASSLLPWESFTFINADLTFYVWREPAGPWICLEAVTRIGPDDTAVAQSRLYDESGPIGTTLQSVLIDPRQL